MKKWIFKIVAGILIWVIVAVIVSFVGGLLVTVGQAQITYLGNFLVKTAGLIGFLAGAWYVIWGKVPGKLEG